MNNYLEQIIDIETEIKELKQKLKDTKEEWCKNEHPLKIGDEVEVTGYSYKGKKMRIDHLGVIKQLLWSEKHVFVATGVILKKDGSKGQQRGEWDHLEYKTSQNNIAEAARAALICTGK